MMRLALLAAAFGGVCAAGPAAADCVTPAHVVTGVALRFQDGTPGRAIALGDGVIRIDYRRDGSGYYETREGPRGIFETRIAEGGAPRDVIGVWSDEVETRQLQGNPPEPVPGTAWDTVADSTWELSDFSGMPQEGRLRFSVRYDFLDLREVTLSGCTYRVIAVEATLRHEDRFQVERYAYFADLGFGVRTQVRLDDGTVLTNGLSAMEPAT